MSRAAYTDEEIVALKALLVLFAEEVSRCGQAIHAYLAHAITCGNENHRNACIAKVRQLTVVLMDQTRYGAWVEAELAKVRMFDDPKEILKSLIVSQEKQAVEIAAGMGEVYEGEQTKLDESKAMDAKATHPAPETKQ